MSFSWNSSNVDATQRANHTGTQLAATISDFDSTVSANPDVSANTTDRHTHSNKATLDLITEAFTTALKSAYDSASSWVVTNGTNVLNHLSNTSNPHSVTKTQVGLGNVENINTSIASNITLEKLGAATYNNVQLMQNIFHSAGNGEGGEVINAGSGQVQVNAGKGWIRATNNQLATLLAFDYPALPPTTIPDGSTRYVRVSYNGGSPIVSLETTDNFNNQDEFGLGIAIREGSFIHTGENAHNVGDHAGKMIDMIYQTMGLQRDNYNGGLILGQSGDANRRITMSAGALWGRLNRKPIAAINTGTGSTYDRYYRDGAGGFTLQSGITSFNNSQWDNGTGTLATLGSNKWVNIWFYLELDGQLVAMYGGAEYSGLPQAQVGIPPTTLPPRLNGEHAILIGRFTVQQGNNTATIQTIFDTTFGVGGIINHNDTGSLNAGDYIHLTAAEYSSKITNFNTSVKALTTVNNTIVVGTGGDVDFTSVKAAIDSVTTATSVNRFTILVYSGVYVDDTITMKEYVDVIGVDPNSVVINVNDTSKNVINLVGNTTIENLVLLGSSDAGKAIFNLSSDMGAGKASTILRCTVGNTDSILNSTLGAGEFGVVAFEGITSGYGVGYSKGFNISGDGVTIVSLADTKDSIVNAVGNYVTITGTNNRIILTNVGVLVNTPFGGSMTKFINCENGATVQAVGTSIDGCVTGISNPNVGAGCDLLLQGFNVVNATTDINILNAGTTGSFFGTAEYEKTFIHLDSTFYIENKDRRIVTVAKAGGDFESIAAAVAFITDAASDNIYLIKVGAGEFTEPYIDLSSKPYISIQGASINATSVVPDANNHHVFRIGETNELSFFSIAGLGGVGFAGVYFRNGGNFAQLHKLSIGDCDICVLAENTITDSYLYLEYVDFFGTYAFGIKIVNSGAGRLFVNAENQYSLPDVLSDTAYHVEGTNAVFELLASGNENPTAQGKGVVVHTGAMANVISSYFTNFTTAISLPNTGATPTAFFMSTKLAGNTTAISVQHPTGAGSFNGSMQSPVISIVSTSTFGIQYLENLLGNKRNLYFDATSINTIPGTNPTTDAATKSYLGDSGFQFIGVKGATADKDGMSINFRIPPDFQRNGRFKVVWTSATGSNPFKLQFIISRKAIGQDMTTTTETGLSSVNNATTAFNVQETDWVTSATTYVVGDTVSIRLYRLANDAADTFTGTVYIQGLLFQYEGNK